MLRPTVVVLILAGVLTLPSLGADSVTGTHWAATDVSTSPGSGWPETEVTVSIDPTDPARMIGGAIVFHHRTGPNTPGSLEGFRDSARYSHDGGATWIDAGALPVLDNSGEVATCSDPGSTDPWVAFDHHGVGYYSIMGYDAGDITAATPCNFQTLAVATTTDGGATWSKPVLVAHGDENFACVPDRDTLFADPASSNVYLTYAALGCAEGQANPLMITHTSDGGRTWSTPIPVTSPEDSTKNAYPASPSVSPSGAIFVSYLRDAPFAVCPYTVGVTRDHTLVSAEVVTAVSRDQGATWARHALGPTCDNEFQTPEEPFAGPHMFTEGRVSIDPTTGVALVAWSSRDVPFSTVHVSVSRDDGATWSAPTVLSDDHARSLYMPTPSLAGGVMRMTYLAMRSDGQYDLLYRESLDGVAWSAETTLSSRSSCACWAPMNGPALDNDFGDYLALDAKGGTIVALWPDDRDPAGSQTTFARVGTY